MIAPESNRPDSHPDDADRVVAPVEPGDRPVTTLRGATVDVDFRRAARAVIGICLTLLVVLAVVFLVAGLHTNSQVNRLRDQGVPVSVTVTRCAGLIGGSGSQNAGYTCIGSYTVGGTHYLQTIPGTATFYRTGSTIQGLVVPSDPKLLSTPALVADQHASWHVFLLPGALIVVALVWGGLLLARRRGRQGRPAGTHSSESR
jgi:predicted membrane channel-forming protein YqfA (hemolysin III family)